MRSVVSDICVCSYSPVPHTVPVWQVRSVVGVRGNSYISSGQLPDAVRTLQMGSPSLDNPDWYSLRRVGHVSAEPYCEQGGFNPGSEHTPVTASNEHLVGQLSSVKYEQGAVDP